MKNNESRVDPIAFQEKRLSELVGLPIIIAEYLGRRAERRQGKGRDSGRDYDFVGITHTLNVSRGAQFQTMEVEETVEPDMFDNPDNATNELPMVPPGRKVICVLSQLMRVKGVETVRAEAVYLLNESPALPVKQAA